MEDFMQLILQRNISRKKASYCNSGEVYNGEEGAELLYQYREAD